MSDKCPLDRQYGDTVCRDGMLWGLTYSEMAPPDSRQCLGECNWSGHKREKSKPLSAWEHYRPDDLTDDELAEYVIQSKGILVS